jgi:hypothetical protein
MGDAGCSAQGTPQLIESPAARPYTGWQRLRRHVVEVLGLGVGILLCIRNWPWSARCRDGGLFVIGATLGFQAILALAIEAILRWSQPHRPKDDDPNPCAECFEPQRPGLPPQELLALEFEYARATASEAMNDRHTVVNFYLVLTGVVLSAVIALVGADRQWPLPTTLHVAGMVLLWVLDIVGWLYLLQLVRLRQAWRGSVLAMNQIKNFYLQNAAYFEPAALKQALRWRPDTVPPAAKPWTIHFFYAVLISLLNSMVYVGGGILGGLALKLAGDQWPWLLAGLLALGVLFFLFSLRMYRLFLDERS